jgi:hypothetical protein
MPPVNESGPEKVVACTWPDAEVLLYADRVRSSAMEVAHRWGYYRHMLERYAECEPVRVKVPNGPACGDKSTEGGAH